MGRRWIIPGVIASLVLVVAMSEYGWAQRSRQRLPTPPNVALEATAAPVASPTGWKPVPVALTPGAPRVTPLVDDPAARTQACGSWDAQATGMDGWTQRECVARLVSTEPRSAAVGASVFITKTRWEMAASSYGVPKSPGPPTDTWVIIVRFDYPDGPTVTIVLDDSTGTPYLRINNT